MRRLASVTVGLVLVLALAAGAAREAGRDARNDVLAYVHYPGVNVSADVVVLDLFTGISLNLTQTPNVDELYPAWWPCPETLCLSYQEVNVDESDLTLVNLVTREVRRMNLYNGRIFTPTWSRDGRLAFWALEGQQHDLFVWDGVGEPLNLTQSATTSQTDPAWAPDGRLSFWDIEANDVFVRELSGAILNVSDHPSNDCCLAWLPDGRLSFVSSRDGNADLYLRDDDGTITRLLVTADLREGFHAWSPRGRLAVSGFDVRLGAGTLLIRESDGREWRLMGNGLASWLP